MRRSGAIDDPASTAGSSAGESRCYRRQGDWEAARADVQDAPRRLSERLGDSAALAHGYFQASIVAERQGPWVLARSYAGAR